MLMSKPPPIELLRAMPDTSIKAIAERLRLARQVLDCSQVEWCRRAGIATNTYNQAEKGRQRLGLDTAIKICVAHRLTLDWLYLGDPSGLRYEVAAAIAELRRARS
jgi:DNA-binding XRE family transcriptional regulator